MAVADELKKTKQYLAAAWDKIEEKRGKVPPQRNLKNLADAIETVGEDIGVITYLDDSGAEQELKVDAIGLANLSQNLRDMWGETANNIVVDGVTVSRDRITKFTAGADFIFVPNYFLASSWESGFTGLKSVVFHENTKEAGDNVLSQAQGDFELDLGGITKVGASFLQSARQFNHPLNLEQITSFGRNCFSSMEAFNQPITFSEELTEITESSFNSLNSFNQPIVIPNSVTRLGEGFLSWCNDFNSPITLSENITEIPSYTLYGLNSFNQPLDLSHIERFGYGVLSSMPAFNQPLDLSNLTNLGDTTLSGCTSFNSPITFGSSYSIGVAFLQNATSFNQPVDISGAAEIGAQFLAGCTSFNSPITLPEEAVTVGTYFLENCDSFVGPLNVGGAVPPTDNYSLATRNGTDKAMYRDGVGIYGTNVAAWLSALPNRTSSPYRTLYSWNPQFDELKQAINDGTAEEKFPVGTELADFVHYGVTDTAAYQWTYVREAPLVIGTYTEKDGKKTVGLFRKHVDAFTSILYTGGDYPNSDGFRNLNNLYVNKYTSPCLRKVISQVSVPWVHNGQVQQVKGRVHLLSVAEVYGTKNPEEGPVWQYFQQGAGTDSPTDGSLPVRVMTQLNDTTARVWMTRTEDTSTTSWCINTGGGITNTLDRSYQTPTFYIVAD